MKRLLFLFLSLLCLAQQGLAWECDFTQYTWESSPFLNNGEFKTSSGLTLQKLWDNEYGRTNNYLAISGSFGNEWTYRHDSSHKDIYANSNQYLAILNLFAGDKVKISFWGQDGGTGKCPEILSNNVKNNAVGTRIYSNTEYEMTKNGTMDFRIRNGIFITKVEIIKEHEDWTLVGIDPSNLEEGQKYYRFRLSDKDFNEPVISVQPAGASVSYSVTTDFSPNGQDVAIMNPQPGKEGDVMFKNIGRCTVTVNVNNNGYPTSTSYIVECWDDDADFVLEDNGTKYRLSREGVLKNRIVNAVGGITLTFGNPDKNTTVVYDQDGHKVAFMRADNGWWDRYPYDAGGWPNDGTYYVFKATSSGKLKFGGWKYSKGGEVKIVWTSNGNRHQVIFNSDQEGYLTTDNYGGSDNFVVNGELNMEAGCEYYLHGTTPTVTQGTKPWDQQYVNSWAPFFLEWFSFSSDFKLVDKDYYDPNNPVEETFGVAATAGATSVTSRAKIIGVPVSQVTIDQIKYKDINSANVSINSDGTIQFNNINFKNTADDQKGGAIYVKLKYGSSYKEFVMTIPYGRHNWDFRKTSRNGGKYDEAGLVSQMWIDSQDWSRVYGVRERSDGKWTNLLYPVLSVRSSVQGNNAFYMDYTTGLVFRTGAESFGGGETANSDPNYHANPQDANETDQNYYLPAKSTSGAELVWMKGNEGKIYFPGVTAGQYIKVYQYRHSDEVGERFYMENLIDLDGKAYVKDSLMRIRGLNRADCVNGDDIKGAVIFRVPLDYQPTDDLTQIPQMTLDDKGWVRIYKIEILDELVPDLRLTDENSYNNGLYPVEFDNPCGSVVLRVKKNADGTKTLLDSEEARTRYYEAAPGKVFTQHGQTAEYEVTSEGSVEFDRKNIIWLSKQQMGAKSPKYNALKLIFKGGNGIVKVTQREKITKDGKTYSSEDNSIAQNCETPNNGIAGGYVTDKKEYYIAVGELAVQDYPYTWDFTDYNMYRLDSDTKVKMSDSQDTELGNYGKWANNPDQSLEPNENEFGQVSWSQMDFVQNGTVMHNAHTSKQQFAQGAQLTTSNIAVAEAEGLGIARPFKGNHSFVEKFTVKDDGTYTPDTKAYPYYDLTNYAIRTDGNALKGAGEMTIPDVTAGMYVFVKASKQPAVTGAKAATRYANADDVYEYVTEAKGDVVITFSDPSTEIYSIGVTNMEKFISKYKYATESRDTTIDYIYTGTQDPKKVFVTNGVNAYGVKDYSETYNLQGINIDRQDHLEATPNVSRTAPVNVVNRQTGIVLHTDNNVATTGEYIPLFVPAVNHQTAADWIYSGEGESAIKYNDKSNLEDGQGNVVNMMAACVNGKKFTSETEGDNTVFILSATYYKYHQSTGENEGTFEGVGFYRLKLTGNDKDDTLRPNTSYLLLPTSNLQTALWNTSTGNGASHAVMFAEDLDGIYDTDAIESVTVEGDNFIMDENAVFYTLSGVKLNGKPSAKGLYICNGKKVLVK